MTVNSSPTLSATPKCFYSFFIEKVHRFPPPILQEFGHVWCLASAFLHGGTVAESWSGCMILDNGNILNTQGPPLIRHVHDVENHHNILLYILELLLGGIMALVVWFSAAVRDTKNSSNFLCLGRCLGFCIVAEEFLRCTMHSNVIPKYFRVISISLYWPPSVRIMNGTTTAIYRANGELHETGSPDGLPLAWKSADPYKLLAGDWSRPNGRIRSCPIKIGHGDRRELAASTDAMIGALGTIVN
jgi:hypothetical protein